MKLNCKTVKNQGRQDTKDRWREIEDRWVDIIEKQSGDESIQWVDSGEHLSYQVKEKPFEIYEEDFVKTMMDYYMFEKGLDVKEIGDKVLQKVLYGSEISNDGDVLEVKINVDGGQNG